MITRSQLFATLAQTPQTFTIVYATAKGDRIEIKRAALAKFANQTTNTYHPTPTTQNLKTTQFYQSQILKIKNLDTILFRNSIQEIDQTQFHTVNAFLILSFNNQDYTI